MRSCLQKNAAPRFEWRFLGALVPGRPGGRKDSSLKSKKVLRGFARPQDAFTERLVVGFEVL